MSPLGIGEFARRSRLSAKALRRYAELGLLVPARVDPDTGYRWYAPDQLGQARLVALLRRIDVPLARIKHILALAPAEAADEVRAYWAAADAEHAARRELVGHLVDRLHGRKSAMSEATGHEERGRAVAERLATGIVHVNDQTLNNDAYAPFGGVGASGNSARFGSQSSWDEFTRWRWLTVRDQPHPFPF